MEAEDRRAKIHREHVEAVDELRARIAELEQRQPELRQEIPAVRKQIAELQREIAAAARAAPEPGDEAEERLAALNGQLEELQERATELAAELEALGPALIQTRCTLGMKMSDFALDDHEGHEDALTYLQPLLNELRSAYGRASWEAERNAAEVDELLQAPSDEDAATLVGRRYDPLIRAETIAVNIEQANVRVCRHRLALVDREDAALHLSHELQLDDAMVVLDEARARVVALQEQKREALTRHGHASVAQRLVKKRFGRR